MLLKQAKPKYMEKKVYNITDIVFQYKSIIILDYYFENDNYLFTGLNASLTIKQIVSGTWRMFNKQIMNAENTYKVHITGVTLDVNFPIDLIPPITVT